MIGDTKIFHINDDFKEWDKNNPVKPYINYYVDGETKVRDNPKNSIVNKLINFTFYKYNIDKQYINRNYDIVDLCFEIHNKVVVLIWDNYKYGKDIDQDLFERIVLKVLVLKFNFDIL